jgi:hypothetical protein
MVDDEKDNSFSTSTSTFVQSISPLLYPFA